MALWRKTSRYYADELELYGLRAALSNHLEEEYEPEYLGALIALEILCEQSDLRDQSVFMALFERRLEDVREASAWDR